MNREYEKYEFCKAADCPVIKTKNHCDIPDVQCIRTAKEFHHWLKENGFKIVKKKKGQNLKVDICTGCKHNEIGTFCTLPALTPCKFESI